ncbi:MAG TPA: glycosyltransferase family 2 protein [Dehalococcoidia bacterium]|nr:glycosyltransferase family 2 protein [Dehalococcoidia bacterium]
MAQAAPKVTIGVPVYNGERFLAEALDSALAQTYGDFEIIISDNASQDGTDEIARSYVARDARVRFVENQTNVGAARNYNKLVRLARGRYFKWLAADDIMAPEFLARCIDVLERHPDVALAYPRTRCIDEDGLVYPDDPWSPMVWPAEPSARMRLYLEAAPWAPVLVFGLMRTEALRRTRLIGPYPGGDLNFVAELALEGAFVELTPALLFFRLHADSLTWAKADPERHVAFYAPEQRSRLARAFLARRHGLEYGRSVLRSDVGVRQKAALASYLATRAVAGALRGLRRRVGSHPSDTAASVTPPQTHWTELIEAGDRVVALAR